MPKEKKRKRSRSRSKSSDRKRKCENKKWQEMQERLNNLTKIVEMLAQKMVDDKAPENNQYDLSPDSDVQNPKAIDDKEMVPVDSQQIILSSDNLIIDEDNQKELTLDPDILNILGEDPKFKPDEALELHAEIKNRWGSWMKEGLSEEVKKSLLNRYPRKGELYTEPPKINLEIMGALAEITKKRDQHFVEIQRNVGTAIIAVGSAMSLILNSSEKEIDELKLLEYLSDAGKLLTETFYQQSTARKAYISPIMKNSVKTLIDSIHSEEWLYGDKLADQMKEAKTIENACQNLKAKDKTPKRRSQIQGNWKGPSVQYKQTGTTVNQRRFLRFRPKTQNRSNQITPREKARTSREPLKK